MTISAFVAFAFMGVVPWFIVLVIVIREFFVTGWRLKALIQGKVFAASSAGKKKTVSQIVAIFLALIFVLMREIEYKSVPFLTGEKEILCEHILFFIMVMAAVLTVSSGVSYFVADRNHVVPRNR